MAKVGVYFEGVDALKKELLKRATMDDVKDVVKLNGSELTAASKRNAPVDTGDLEGSITQELENGGLTSKTMPHVHYGGYQELGTRFIKGRFYLKKAFDVQSAKFKGDLQRLVK